MSQIKRIFVIGFITLMIFFGNVLVINADTNDDAAINELQQKQATAWNNHDATAYADLFAEDGDVVNVVGWWWKGRSEIKNKLSAAFVWVFKDSKLTITDVHIKFLTPEIAVARVKWTMEGAKTPPNIPEPRQGIQLQVLTKQSGKWLIKNFQNTNSTEETPFPTGPPSQGK